MTKNLTPEQHQMLEDLTGLEYTRTGQIRKYQNRSHEESKRLGLVTPSMLKKERIINSKPKDLESPFDRMLYNLYHGK